MRFRDFAKKLVYGPKASSQAYIKHLRSLGMVIGENTVIYAPTKCEIDATRPWMIEIGSNVSITEGVTILTHGYDWSIFKGRDGWVLGSAGHVKIGDNVFIGMNATILKGVEIGDNVIIGAGSVVTKSIPANSVAVGNPACVKCDVDSYLKKREEAQLVEAADLYTYWRRNSPEGQSGGVPPKKIFAEFFWLFEARNGELSDPSFKSVMHLRGSYEKSMELFNTTEPVFGSYEEFLSSLDNFNS
jgi:acetyltransferase-like isoleucine patch superfamily enzyme